MFTVDELVELKDLCGDYVFDSEEGFAGATEDIVRVFVDFEKRKRIEEPEPEGYKEYEAVWKSIRQLPESMLKHFAWELSGKISAYEYIQIQEECDCSKPLADIKDRILAAMKAKIDNYKRTRKDEWAWAFKWSLFDIYRVYTGRIPNMDTQGGFCEYLNIVIEAISRNTEEELNKTNVFSPEKAIRQICESDRYQELYS